jgi:hypothetical protein
MHSSIGRIQSNSLAIFCDRTVHVALVVKLRSQGEMSICKIRLQAQRLTLPFAFLRLGRELSENSQPDEAIAEY